MIFEDTFPTMTIDETKWTVVDGATVDSVGINEPSPEYSLRLNRDDSVESRVIDLSSYSDAILTYHFERTGGGYPPGSGDDLIIEYHDGLQWVELARQPGDGPDMTNYEVDPVDLPPDALHSGFRLQIRSIGSQSSSSIYDDWFVDDVKIKATE